MIFSEEQKVTKFYINLQPDIKDFVVSQRVSNPNLGLNELIRHARQFENAHAKGKGICLLSSHACSHHKKCYFFAIFHMYGMIALGLLV
jgi:hypothetical protein